MNSSDLRLLKIDDFTTVNGEPWETLLPADQRDKVRRAVAVARNGEVGRFEAFCPTAKGTPKWWNVMVSPALVHPACGGWPDRPGSGVGVGWDRVMAVRGRRGGPKARYAVRDWAAQTGRSCGEATFGCGSRPGG